MTRIGLASLSSITYHELSINSASLIRKVCSIYTKCMQIRSTTIWHTVKLVVYRFTAMQTLAASHVKFVNVWVLSMSIMALIQTA